VGNTTYFFKISSTVISSTSIDSWVLILLTHNLRRQPSFLKAFESLIMRDFSDRFLLQRFLNFFARFPTIRAFSRCYNHIIGRTFECWLVTSPCTLSFMQNRRKINSLYLTPFAKRALQDSHFFCHVNIFIFNLKLCYGGLRRVYPTIEKNQGYGLC